LPGGSSGSSGISATAPAIDVIDSNPRRTILHGKPMRQSGTSGVSSMSSTRTSSL
jgi:hypothetical protein